MALDLQALVAPEHTALRQAVLGSLLIDLGFGFVLLMLLMVYALYNDLVRIDAFKFIK